LTRTVINSCNGLETVHCWHWSQKNRTVWEMVQRCWLWLFLPVE